MFPPVKLNLNLSKLPPPPANLVGNPPLTNSTKPPLVKVPKVDVAVNIVPELESVELRPRVKLKIDYQSGEKSCHYELKRDDFYISREA